MREGVSASWEHAWNQGLFFMPQSVAAASLDPPPLPSGYAVIGIIGPDSPPHRQALRGWTSLVAPEVLVRFAVSLRDRAHVNPWWTGNSHAQYEPDVDFIDRLGQSAGAGVVILALFDSWLRTPSCVTPMRSSSAVQILMQFPALGLAARDATG